MEKLPYRGHSQIVSLQLREVFLAAVVKIADNLIFRADTAQVCDVFGRCDRRELSFRTDKSSSIHGADNYAGVIDRRRDPHLTTSLNLNVGAPENGLRQNGRKKPQLS
jgi:hypothetical protein